MSSPKPRRFCNSHQSLNEDERGHRHLGCPFAYRLLHGSKGDVTGDLRDIFIKDLCKKPQGQRSRVSRAQQRSFTKPFTRERGLNLRGKPAVSFMTIMASRQSPQAALGVRARQIGVTTFSPNGISKTPRTRPKTPSTPAFMAHSNRPDPPPMALAVP